MIDDYEYFLITPCFNVCVNQGNVHNAMLFVGVESHKKSDRHPVVLDG